jgi:PilZ domain-containing protein
VRPLTTKETGRQASRFAVSLGVVISTGEAYYFIETQNVSEKGLCLRPKNTFPIGTQHRMVFGRPPQLPRIDAIGTVRWSETGKGVGLEFTSISPHDQCALREFLSFHSKVQPA